MSRLVGALQSYQKWIILSRQKFTLQTLKPPKLEQFLMHCSLDITFKWKKEKLTVTEALLNTFMLHIPVMPPPVYRDVFHLKYHLYTKQGDKNYYGRCLTQLFSSTHMYSYSVSWWIDSLTDWLIKWMTERLDNWMTRWPDNQRLNGQTTRWLDDQMTRWLDGQTAGWPDNWTTRQLDDWTTRSQDDRRTGWTDNWKVHCWSTQV